MSLYAEPDRLTHTFNPIIPEAEAGQADLSEVEGFLVCIVSSRTSGLYRVLAGGGSL